MFNHFWFNSFIFASTKNTMTTTKKRHKHTHTNMHTFNGTRTQNVNNFFFHIQKRMYSNFAFLFQYIFRWKLCSDFYQVFKITFDVDCLLFLFLIFRFSCSNQKVCVCVRACVTCTVLHKWSHVHAHLQLKGNSKNMQKN